MGESRDYAAWLEVGNGVEVVNRAAAEVRHKRGDSTISMWEYEVQVAWLRRYRRRSSVAEWRRRR